MDWPVVVVVLQVMFQPCLSVLFTVEAERTLYESEFGGDVVMGCRFQPKLSNPGDQLRVTWHWITQTSIRDVYRIDNGVEQLASQDPQYQGRVRLLREELDNGLARLQVSRLRMNDSGTYRCVVQTGEGADYKTITLSVKAPYKEVSKQIQRTAEGDELLLTCQSEGYPNSSVVWQDGNQRRIQPITTTVLTPDQLFKVTSEIRIHSSDKNSYTCSFTSDGSSATFHIPDDIPLVPVKNNAPIVAVSIGLIMLVIITVIVFMYRRRKGSSAPSTRNLLVDGRSKSVSPADCLQVKDSEEEIIIIDERCMEENLEAFMKSHYSHSAGARCDPDAFGEEELLQRLQNNEGQPVNLQVLLPEAGGVLLLEGPPESGKTNVARVLVLSWTRGPTCSLSNAPDLSAIRLLFCVDCSKAKGDLFQEITTQLSLAKKIAEDDLRTVLTRNSEALLLLDGYREGNQDFDESFRRFLSERGGCRVLVTACPGHCPVLRGVVGTEGVLELQTQTAKY